MNRLNSISVREKTGKKIVKELTGNDIPIVCDPTLLFTAKDWMEIQKPERIISDKYIFCYFLGNNPEQRKFANRLKAVTGFKLVRLKHLDEFIKSDELFGDFAPYDVGPSEYIFLIRDAEYVCTDSFHGTVFSILHEKKFFSFKRYKNDSIVSNNSRITSLLSLLNLKNRFLNGYEEIDDCLYREIDYDLVNSQLMEFRNYSMNFLKNALTNVGIEL